MLQVKDWSWTEAKVKQEDKAHSKLKVQLLAQAKAQV